MSWTLGAAVLLLGAGCDDGAGDDNVPFVGSCEGDDHGDTVASGTDAAVAEPIEAEMCAPTDVDVFRTGTLPVGDEVTAVMVSPLDAAANPRLSVLKVDEADNGELLRQGTGGAMNFTTVFHTVSSESGYALEASVSGANEALPYRFVYQRANFSQGCPQDTLEPNNSPTQALFAGSGRSFAGVICEDDLDVFQVGDLEASGPSLVLVSLVYDGGGGGGRNAYLKLGLSDAEGRPMAGEYLVTEDGPSYLFQRVEPGEAPYIEVEGFKRLGVDEVAGTNDYILSVDVAPAAPCTDDDREPDEALSSAKGQEALTPVAHTLCPGDGDWVALGELNLRFPVQDRLEVTLTDAVGVGATLWFFGTLEPEGPEYYVPVAFTEDGALDQAEKTLQHEIALTGQYYLEIKGGDPTVSADYSVSYEVISQ